MRPGVLSVCLMFVLLSGCGKTEVELLPIDILTGGTSKDWEILDFTINSDTLTPSDIMMDSKVTFGREFDETGTYTGTFYTWHSLIDKSENFRCEVRKFTASELHLHEIMTDGTVNPTPDIWNVSIINHKEILLTLRSEDTQEFLKDPITEQYTIPNSNYGVITIRTLHLIASDSITSARVI